MTESTPSHVQNMAHTATLSDGEGPWGQTQVPHSAALWDTITTLHLYLQSGAEVC